MTPKPFFDIFIQRHDNGDFRGLLFYLEPGKEPGAPLFVSGNHSTAQAAGDECRPHLFCHWQRLMGYKHPTDPSRTLCDMPAPEGEHATLHIPGGL